MSRIAPVVPAESDLLCEGCGYTLNGLPTSGNCPECGKPIEQSIGTHRLLPAWEDPDDPRPAIARFIATTARVLFRPGDFFATLQTRAETRRGRSFAYIHWAISSVLFSAAVWLHLAWYADIANWDVTRLDLALSGLIPIAVWLLVAATNRLAAWLTNFEATWRGFRMPIDVVRRALYYHAPHYFPPAMLVLLIVGGMHLLALLRIASYYTVADRYIYSLCGAIIVAALYLFQTYWTAMRRLMYANR